MEPHRQQQPGVIQPKGPRTIMELGLCNFRSETGPDRGPARTEPDRTGPVLFGPVLGPEN